MRLSGLVPRRALDVIDRVRTQRFLATVSAPTAEYVRRHGLVVRGGPFTGMRYLEGLERSGGDLVAKLIGTYECELHGVLDEWIAQGFERIIDVGCAEGYYAVGFATAMRSSTVDAFDIDESAREQCASMARVNDVAGRVNVLGLCDPAALSAYPERGVALLSDCEGYERTLLDPDLAPRLRNWWILVELHEFIDPSITDTIRARFADSHEIEIIEGQARPQEPAELAFMSSRQRRAVLGEHRPGPMRWAHLRPR